MKGKVIRMIRFDNDYNTGTHPAILDALISTNDVQQPGYGMDSYSLEAQTLIKKACNAPDADVHFMIGGTQANTTIIASILRPHQAVISADSGHIAVHETGAIESTGHKVIELPGENGKISAEQVELFVNAHSNDPTHEHIPQPKLVYISQPTELGSLYSKSELASLYAVCKSINLYLMVDGARLGYGLASKSNDIMLQDLAQLCDIFYIGGTKVGAMFGEAIVIMNDYLKTDFRYIMKQRGGMLAKGRFVGLQFKTLFDDGLYFEVSNHAITLANKLVEGLRDMNIEFLIEPETNQIFPLLSEAQIKRIQGKYAFYEWEKQDDKTAVRFCTSWSTKEEDVESLLRDLNDSI